MKQPIVIIGLGQIGSVFAQGFLQIRRPVYPIEYEMDLRAEAKEIPDPEIVLVAVKEEVLPTVLSIFPQIWQDRLALIQNELVPRDWEMHNLPFPTVSALWFEKRKGKNPDPYFPSPVFGPHADLLCAAMQAVELPVCVVEDYGDMVFELVRKNVYIVSKNITGLTAQGTVGEVWRQHRDDFLSVAQEVLQVQEWLTGKELPEERLFKQLAHDIESLPDKSATGSSAPARLKRMIQHADQAGLPVPELRRIQTLVK
jgi:hypothetical protein